MAEYLPNGIGEASGDSLATAQDLTVSGKVWYVDSATGVDGSSPAGLNRSKPLATLAQAQTNAAAGDTVVLMDGHAETIAALTISKSLTIVGGGTSSGLPTVTLTRSAASGSLLTVTAARVELRNIKFTQSAQGNTDERITVTGDSFRMIGCYNECTIYDDNAVLELGSGADSATVEDTTFISTGTYASGPTYDLPDSAIKVTAAIADLTLKGVTLDGGEAGFANPYAMDASAFAITALRAEQISLLNGADVTLHASTTGRFQVTTATGSSKVIW